MRKESSQYSEKNRTDWVSNLEAQALLADMFPERDISPEFLDQMQSWAWEQETHGLPKSGLAVSSAYYGHEVSGAEAIVANGAQILAKQGNTNPQKDVSTTSGFSKMYYLDPQYSDEEYALSQEIVLRQLLEDTLEQLALKPTNIDAVFVTTSIPIDEDFATRLAAAAGLNPNIPIIAVSMACNSTGWAIAETHNGFLDSRLAESVESWENGNPANIAVLSIDDQTRHMNKKTDTLSPQLFSTGAAAMVFKYHPTNKDASTFHPVTSIHHASVDDGTEYLEVMQTYKDWKKKPIVAKYLKEPEPGAVINMHPRAGVTFIRYASAIAAETLGDYVRQPFDEERLCAPSDIATVIVHHPSQMVFEALKSRLVEAGVSSEAINWTIFGGNVPVATVPMSLGHEMKNLNPGDHIMFLSFGAGGEYTSWIAQLGELESAV